MSGARVGILISGSGSNMVSLVEAMQRPGAAAEPALVLSNRADAGGLARAEALGVKTAVVDHRPHGEDRASFEAEVQAVLEAEGVELVCLAGFMRILTAETIRKWAGRMLNVHPSLLPLFKGLHTHERALAAGVAVHGCTVHLATEELDSGPILGQAVVPVLAGDTPDNLAARVLVQEHRLYPAVLDAYARDPDTLRAAPISLFLNDR